MTPCSLPNRELITAASHNHEISGLRLRPCAKINLYLEVVGKLKDGYHEIRTLIQPVALYDELVLRRIPKGVRFSCQTCDGLPGKEVLLCSPGNIVTEAIELFFSRIGESPSIDAGLFKNIPIGGGMAGGSSDSASTILGLNRMWGNPLEEEELKEISADLGMDVSFFLGPRRPALCTGRGEIVEKRFKKNAMTRFFCVLVNPGRFLKTRDVYRSLSLTETNSKANILDSESGKFRIQAPAANLLTFLQKDGKISITDIVNIIRNDLEGTAIKLCPQISEIKDVLNAAGALKSFVCGSGPTVCGITATRCDAEGVMKRIKGKNEREGWWSRIVSTLQT